MGSCCPCRSSRAIQSNSWVAIYGSNLAPPGSDRTWGEQDIVDGRLPLSLDGVSVTTNAKPAFVEYISPTQVNVLAPDDTATGPANVIVANEGVDSTPFSTQMQTYSPAFFTFSPPNQRYVAAIIPSEPGGAFDYLAPSGALGTGTSSRPARGVTSWNSMPLGLARRTQHHQMASSSSAHTRHQHPLQ